MNAFEKYLLSIPRDTAIMHLAECLANQGPIAFELIEKIHGPNWHLPDTTVADFLNDTLAKLEHEKYFETSVH